MAAKYPRHTIPVGSISYQYDGESPVPFSTVRIRERSRDVIPRGAVASRVKLLQGFTELQPARYVSPPRRIREDSRSGFGRRVSRRFGNPAIQSAQPDEEPRVESRHSFLGLNPVRTNHEEEHALTDQTVHYSRSPGINGQIDQEDARRQYDAASPWGVLPRTISIPSVSRRGFSTGPDAMKENDSSRNHRLVMTQSSSIPSTTKKNSTRMHHHKIHPHRPKFIDSEASIATTSTIRRQNVRDLFDDYGIQRPAGLASREVSQNVDEPTCVSNMRTFCHVCSWNNSCTSIKCMRCSHQFCTRCKENPSEVTRTQEKKALDHSGMSTKYQQRLHRESPNPKGNRVEHDPVKKHQARPGPTPLQSRKCIRKPPSPPINFPDFYDPSKSQKFPVKMSPVQVDRQEPTPAHVLSGFKTTTSVKDSPFLIADLKSPRQSLGLFPSGRRGETHHTAHNHYKYHSKHHRLVNYASTVPSESLSCDITICRATHHGHQPFRHASACPRKKPKQRVPEDTENGYIADTSRVDDAVYLRSRCNSPLSRPDPRLAQQPEPDYSHLTSSSRPDSCNYSTHDIPEYVECRGYPRTGHARHGSPVSSGVVGECQHCLDDCQCAACQGTHHNVRCCVHTDHQTIVHHHHTPRRIVTVECSEEHVLPNIGGSPSRDHRPAIQLYSSNVQHHVATEVQDHHASHRAVCTEEISEAPSVKCLVAKTPQETVTSSRKMTETEAIKHEQNGKGPQDAEPHSEESNPTSQHHPQEHPSFGASAETMGGAWFRTPSPHEHGHVHERRNSCPPSRKDSLRMANCEIEMTGAISPRTQIETTPPESEKVAQENFTNLKQKRHSSVQDLKEQLLSNREDPQKIPKGSSEQINLPAHSGVAELAQRVEQKANKDLNDHYHATRTPSIWSKGSTGSKKKNWKLKLVDWNPEGRRKAGEEHCLSDDEIGSETETKKASYKALPSVSTATNSWMDFSQSGEREKKDKGKGKENKFEGAKESGKEHNLSVDEVVMEDLLMEHEYDCLWKKRFEEVSTNNMVRNQNEKRDLGILGITVLVHLAGREDLVAQADSWTGGELKAEA